MFAHSLFQIEGLLSLQGPSRGKIVLCGELNIVHGRVDCSQPVLAEELFQVHFDIFHVNP
jgi:exonuclease III